MSLPNTDQWLELKIAAPAELAEPLAAMFSRYGDAPAVIETALHYDADAEPPPPPRRATIKAFLRLDDDTARKRAVIEGGIKLIGLLRELPAPVCTPLDPQEWQDRVAAPFRVGKRFVIVPAHSRCTASAGDVVIPITPGLGFGTGSHPTTAMVLEAMEELEFEGTSVLDVGSGSGVLSIAAAKLGAATVLGIEYDPPAVKASVNNVAAAGCADAVRIRQGYMSAGMIGSSKFGVVLANLTSAVLIELAPVLLRALAPGATLVCSGMMQEHAAEVLSTFRKCGARVERELRRGEWRAATISS